MARNKALACVVAWSLMGSVAVIAGQFGEKTAPAHKSGHNESILTSAEENSGLEPLSQEEAVARESNPTPAQLLNDKALSDIDEPAAAKDSSSDDSAEAGEIEVVKERFSDGKVHIEREVTQDAFGNYINHGSWKMWDEQGKLIAQGQHRHNQRHGEWIRWYRSAAEAELLNKMSYQQFTGPYISQATFIDGQLHGTWTIWDGHKHKISQWEYAQDRRHGKSTWWYSNGQKMREVDYRDGDIDGKLMEWTADGKLTNMSTYEGGRKLEAKTANYPNGKKHTEGLYLFSKESVQTPDDWWNGKLLTTTRQGKDEKHGPWRAWYNNGQIQLEGEYRHDVPVGRFTWWHQNGQTALEGEYREGKQQGVWTWWHENGQKATRGQYVDGAPINRWTWWKPDGKVSQAGDLSPAEGVVVEAPAARDTQNGQVPQAPSLKPTSPNGSRPAQSAARPGAPSQGRTRTLNRSYH